MATINTNYDKLGGGYLFSEIAKRTAAFQEANPNAEVMKLGIGNTTEPLTPTITEAMETHCRRMGESEGWNPSEAPSEIGALFHEAELDKYTGYGTEQGNSVLRAKIAGKYAEKGVELEPSEVFVSDGAKPDSGNIQSIFGLDDIVAVQDPAYPVYVDTNVIAGRTGAFDEDREQYEGIVYMPCTESNGFIPSPPEEKVDLIYLCSPNNPTGAVAKKEQLQRFVDYARERKAALIFDAAYSPFISDDELPRSIYEVDGAKECAIEISSFSKIAGFTGVRLGWTVVPNEMLVEGTEPGKVQSLWNRRQGTYFNGAALASQAGGLAALTTNGQIECQELVDFYMENASIIKQGLEDVGLRVFGGENAPYLWMQTPNGMDSWAFFDKMLNEAHVVGTPGSGFGPGGKGYLRLSAFGHRGNVEKAVQSIKDNLEL